MKMLLCSSLVFRAMTSGSYLRRYFLSSFCKEKSRCLSNFVWFSCPENSVIRIQNTFIGQINKKHNPNVRLFSRNTEDEKFRNKTVLLYISALTILVGGLSYAAVPLYRIYCQATGRGGQAVADSNQNKIEAMKKASHRVITVHFNADTISSMQWNFKPQQRSIKVVPGETALAFYVAKNPTDIPINGIATYNVMPFEAGQYFNKIQCFCFEEQRLNPQEEVDMPVFFYLDPDFAEDPKMETIKDITLSYTFFEAKEGFKLPF